MARVTVPSTGRTRSRVLHALLAEGEGLRPAKPAGKRGLITRAEFWRRADVDRGNGQQALDDLTELGLVEPDQRRLGWRLGVVLALSLGTESARGALVDANGTLHYPHALPPQSQQLVELSPKLLLDRLAHVAHEVLAAALVDHSELPLLGVATSWPTPLSAQVKMPSVGVLRHAGWASEKRSVVKLAEERLRLDKWAATSLDQGVGVARSHAINDANALALSVAFRETRRRAVDPGDGKSGAVVCVRIGGGVGSGLVMLAPLSHGRSAFLASHLVEGRGYAGEIAHLPLTRADIEELGVAEAGLQQLRPVTGCACKRAVCLDAVTSARAIVQRVREAGVLDNELAGYDRDSDALRIVLEHVQDPAVSSALRQTGMLLARALAGGVMLLNPRSVFFGGAGAHPALVDGVRERLGDWDTPHDDQLPQVTLLDSVNDGFSGVQGAALAALRGQVYRRFDDYDKLNALPLPYKHSHLRDLALTLRTGDLGAQCDKKRLELVLPPRVQRPTQKTDRFPRLPT